MHSTCLVFCEYSRESISLIIFTVLLSKYQRNNTIHIYLTRCVKIVLIISDVIPVLISLTKTKTIMIVNENTSYSLTKTIIETKIHEKTKIKRKRKYPKRKRIVNENTSATLDRRKHQYNDNKNMTF